MAVLARKYSALRPSNIIFLETEICSQNIRLGDWAQFNVSSRRHWIRLVHPVTLTLLWSGLDVWQVHDLVQVDVLVS